MTGDWSNAEDRRPGLALVKPQPEKTARGKVWTQLVTFHWPERGYTQMTIREVGDQYLFNHGRIYPIPQDEDGA